MSIELPKTKIKAEVTEGEGLIMKTFVRDQV